MNTLKTNLVGNTATAHQLPSKVEALKGKHKLYFDMLKYKRPSGMPIEDQFVKEFIQTLHKQYNHVSAQVSDIYGNQIVTVPRVDGSESRVLFSAHTDTVHVTEGYQTLNLSSDGIITSNSNECLGADDTTGVYIMLRLIEAGVPATYVFHRDEEVGCLGSKWIIGNNKAFLEQFDQAIAFDRMGTGEIITHQTTGKCASNEYANALAQQLYKVGELGFSPSPNGIYTDTAHYNELIPECINLSVGYYNQHTPTESQDLVFLDRLIEALVKVDWEGLPIVRDVKDCADGLSFNDSVYSYEASIDECLAYVTSYPEAIANLLYENHFTAYEIEEYIKEVEGGTGINYAI